jgi:Phage integrase family
VRFHDLRHSHATQLLLAGVHPKVAQERLGHSTISTTLDLYGHVTTTMQEDPAGRLDAAFRGAIKAASDRDESGWVANAVAAANPSNARERNSLGISSKYAGLAQWQCSGFVNRRSGVRIPHPAP